MNHLINVLSGRFYKNFSSVTAKKIIENDITDELYTLITDNSVKLSKEIKEKVIFRGAYVLEEIYFNHNESFDTLRNRFFIDFNNCENESAKRHFSKIMAHLVSLSDLEIQLADKIAETAASWAIDPKSRVAVIIWSVEILKSLKDRVKWTGESWNDILDIINANPTPAIQSRMRSSWKREKQNA